jgi:iron(III) transport system permease protein
MSVRTDLRQGGTDAFTGLRRLLPAITPMGVITSIAVVTLVYLLLVPLAVTVFSAFRGPVEALPFEARAVNTVQNFVSIYQSGALSSTLLDTAIFVGGSVVVAFVIGLTLAWLIERTDLPIRNFIFLAALTPLVLPGIILSQSWVLLLTPNLGFLNRVIRFILPFFESGPINGFSMYGMILVQGVLFVPFFTLLLTSIVRNMDGSLEEASRASGASTVQTLRRVTLPMLTPGLLSVVLLGAILIMGVFEVPLLFGIGAGADVISLRMWLSLNPIQSGLPAYGELSAFGLIFLVIVYMLFFVYARVTRYAARFATITGKGYRPTRLQLGNWKYPTMLGLGLYFTVTVLFPLFVLVWSSFFKFYVPPSIAAFEQAKFGSYGTVLTDPEFYGALYRTLLVSGLAATIAVLLSMVIAWKVVRAKRTPLVKMLDLFATSSVAIPAAVAGYAFLVLYLAVADYVPIVGTVWILVLAYAFRTSVAYRINQAGITQLAKELEEASSASGGSPLSTMRRVIMPLLAPNMVVAWLLLFLLGTHEFTIAIFLTNQDTFTLPVLLFNKLGAGQAGGFSYADEAGAIGVLFAVGSLATAGLLRFVVLKRIRRDT